MSDIDIQTLDHFVTIGAGGFKLKLEGAVQYGSNNSRDQRAWAGHANLSKEILPKTTLGFTADAASGGGNSTTSRTFDNLYPSNHDQYGLADLQGWKNMNHLAISLENRSFKSLTLRASANSYSLRDPSDGWYTATGVINPGPKGPLIDPTGQSGRDIGQELDFQASYSIKHFGKISAGIAIFEPGNFIQNLTGHSNQMTFGFLQYSLGF